jgi:serine/alanine racemase
MPAVKANAYGHGAVLVSQELNRVGVRAFCVATAAEGAQLRENGVTGEILVLGYTHPRQFSLLGRYDLTQTVPERSYAETLDAFGQRVKVQIKIDTGMHRLGERWDRLEEIAPIFTLPRLHVTGVFTHLCATSGISPQDRAFTLEQNRAFHACVAGLRELGCTVPKVHALSSYGLLRYPEIGGDYARTGIALYGVLSEKKDQETCPVNLRPVLSLKARVAQVRQVRKGEGAGYDLQFVARRDSRLAVLTIGYADGLPRSLSCGVGAVLLHGRKAPVAGRVCMDQTLVDVTDLPNASPGDVAVLIGTDGD